MLTPIRESFSDSTLGLDWDDLRQHPEKINDIISLLLIEEFRPGKNTIEFRVGLTVKRWVDSVSEAEEFISVIAEWLSQKLIRGSCLGGLTLTAIDPVQIEFSSIAEEAESTELSNVVVSFRTTITLTKTL